MIFETHFDPLIEDYDKNGKLSLRAICGWRGMLSCGIEIGFGKLP